MQQMTEKSMFIKIEQYKEVLGLVNHMKKKLNEAKEVLHKLTELREEEGTELEMWTNTLKDIEARIEHIDKTMFEAGSS